MGTHCDIREFSFYKMKFKNVSALFILQRNALNNVCMEFVRNQTLVRVTMDGLGKHATNVSLCQVASTVTVKGNLIRVNVIMDGKDIYAKNRFVPKAAT